MATPLLFCLTEASRWVLVRLSFLRRLSSRSNTPAMAFHTPLFPHFVKRYQQVLPEPYRSGGISSHRQQVDSTYKMPLRIARSSLLGLPVAAFLGRSGRSSSHSLCERSEGNSPCLFLNIMTEPLISSIIIIPYGLGGF